MRFIPYQVGETVNIALRGAVIRDVGINYLDLTLPDGEELCIDHSADSVEIRRSIPAGGEPQKGDVWEDGQGNKWFVVQECDRYENKRVRLTRDGCNTYDIAQVHQDYVLVKRLFRSDPTEGEQP